MAPVASTSSLITLPGPALHGFSSTLTNSGQRETSIVTGLAAHMCWLCAEDIIRELDISAHRSRVGTELLLAWEAPLAGHGLWRRPRANCVVHLWFPVWLPGHPAQLGVHLQMDNGTAVLPAN